jgi:hypothetical protein
MNFLTSNLLKNLTKMEKPKSLKWSLAHGYAIAGINGTDNKFCEVSVNNVDAPAGYYWRASFLIDTKWMASHYPEIYHRISLPF